MDVPMYKKKDLMDTMKLEHKEKNYRTRKPDILGKKAAKKIDCLCFPVVKFCYKDIRRKYTIKAGNLPHLDDTDDWWDYWFTIGKRTYQLCGDYEKGKRLFRNLRIYVYPKNSTLDDSERIDEITDVRIVLEPYKDNNK